MLFPPAPGKAIDMLLLASEVLALYAIIDVELVMVVTMSSFQTDLLNKCKDLNHCKKH